MKHTKIIKTPITKFIPLTDNIKIEKEYPRYMTYCYTELTKGSKPIYKIICNDKELLEHYTSEFCTTNNLETLPRFKVNYYPRKEELYDNPVTISCETGEIVE